MNEMTIVNVLILLANLAVLGLGLKVYTEVLKEKAQQRRAKEAQR